MSSANATKTEEMVDCPTCGTPTHDIGPCFACAAKKASTPRLVIATKDGVITGVYAATSFDVVVVDLDETERRETEAGVPSIACPMKVDGLDVIPNAVNNELRMLEGFLPQCGYCKAEFDMEAAVDHEFCSAVCSESTWRIGHEKEPSQVEEVEVRVVVESTFEASFATAESKLYSLTSAAFSDTANAIFDDQAFRKTLDSNETGWLISIMQYRLGEISAIPATVAENFPSVIAKWDAAKAERQAVTSTNSLCPACSWLQGHSSVCPRVTRSKVADLQSAHVPQVGWSDTEIFEVNYPDKIQVQIHRTEQDEVEVVLWKIGDDHPLDGGLFYLPGKTDCVDCGGRVGYAELNSNRLCRDCGPTPDDELFLDRLKRCLSPDYIGKEEPYIYADYRGCAPEAATFIVCGPWTISKQRTTTGMEYVLEASLYDYGDSVTPPSADAVPVDAFKDVFTLARRLMDEDAKRVIEARLENVATEGPVF